MASRLDGFYYARWEGLNPDGLWGQGVVFLKDGNVFGGDSQSCFRGEYEDHGDMLVARVRIFPLVDAYKSVTGHVETKPWDLPDIRGSVQKGDLPVNVEARLDSQRYEPEHQAVSLFLQRISLI